MKKNTKTFIKHRVFLNDDHIINSLTDTMIQEGYTQKSLKKL